MKRAHDAPEMNVGPMGDTRVWTRWSGCFTDVWLPLSRLPG
jgi:hypothetical protein